MDNLITFQLHLIQWLQDLGTWLIKPMEILSLSGTEYFYLLVAPAIYWCWDTTLGLQTGLLLMVNANINAYLKILLHTARPLWISKSVQPYAFESSFGLPSGHAQNAVTFWGTVGAYFRKRGLWVLLGVLIFLIGLSRLYLAVHFLHDILIGWLVGIIMLWLFLRITPAVSAWIKRVNFATQISVIFAFSLCLIFIGFFARLGASGFQLPTDWITMAASSFPEEDPINPLAISGIVSNAGAFFGLAAGACWIKLCSGFDAHGKAYQLLGRYILGAVGVGILWFGLGEIFPRGETWLPLLLRFLRYGLVGLWVTALAPMLFIKLHLANPKS